MSVRGWRLPGASERLWEGYPSEYLDIAVFVTDLGDVTAIILLISLLYWLTDRRKAALIAGYTVAGLSVILLLKVGFAMPRPEVDIIAREYDQYGFPSAHAFVSVVVYGGLLYVFDRHRDPLVAVGIAILVIAISLSRVVLGLHYLGDLLAGGALGLGFLLTMEKITTGDPRRAFSLALLAAIPAVVVTNGEALTLAVIAFGASVGGLVGTARLDSVPPLRSRLEALLLGVCGLAFLVAISLAESAFAGGNAILTAGFHAVLVIGVFGLPIALGRIELDVLAGSRNDCSS